MKCYLVTYACDTDPKSLEPLTLHVMAYDAEHAEEKFYDSDDGDVGWRVLSVRLAQSRPCDETAHYRAA